MHSFKLVMDRDTAQRTGEPALKMQETYLVGAARRGRGKKHWKCVVKRAYKAIECSLVATGHRHSFQF